MQTVKPKRADHAMTSRARITNDRRSGQGGNAGTGTALERPQTALERRQGRGGLINRPNGNGATGAAPSMGEKRQAGTFGAPTLKPPTGRAFARGSFQKVFQSTEAPDSDRAGGAVTYPIPKNLKKTAFFRILAGRRLICLD